MIASICLVAGASLLSQTTYVQAWSLAPQLAPGQELVYSGSYIEESLTEGVQVQRRYHLEIRAVVLEAVEKKWKVALLTSLQLRKQRGSAAPPPPPSVRCEIVWVGKDGRITDAKGNPLSVILTGPPTSERGCFLPAPKSKVLPKDEWSTNDPGRPPISWRSLKVEAVSGTQCLRIVGEQQSTDWGAPRADRAAWRRQEVVWVAGRSGVVYRLDRLVERRDPAHIRASFRHKVAYELESNRIYPRKLFAAYRTEIEQVDRFASSAEELLGNVARNKDALEAIKKRIGRYLTVQSGSGLHLAALRQVQYRIDAALRGELVVPASETKRPSEPRFRIGYRVPDFLVPSYVARQPLRLYKHLGRPILLVFYRPDSPASFRALYFAKQLQREHAFKVRVIALSVAGKPTDIRKQHRELDLTFPVGDGRGLTKTFSVDATPRLVLIDGRAVVRFASTGWGLQVPRQVRDELRECLKTERETRREEK